MKKKQTRRLQSEDHMALDRVKGGGDATTPGGGDGGLVNLPGGGG